MGWGIQGLFLPKRRNRHLMAHNPETLPSKSSPRADRRYASTAHAKNTSSTRRRIGLVRHWLFSTVHSCRQNISRLPFFRSGSHRLCFSQNEHALSGRFPALIHW